MEPGSQTWPVIQPIGAAGRITCGHTGVARQVLVDGSGCPQYRRAGGDWVNPGHPVARTLTEGESWGWCYVDEIFLETSAGPARGGM